MVIGKGYSNRLLTEQETREIFAEGLAQIETESKKLLIIIPDSTRSGPIPLCFRTLTDLLLGKAKKLDFIVALGTHIEMDDERLCAHLGISQQERDTRYAQVGLYNHDWQNGLKYIGTIPAAEIRELTDGMMDEDVPVRINARLFDYDRVIICGPVFPHEIAGFSGGNKYFFPGVSGPEIINMTHWLGGLTTNIKTIGVEDTAVRAVLNRAAALITVPKSCFSMVVRGHDDLSGLFFGSPEDSQRAAAELSAQVNVTYVDRTYQTIISIMPEIYDDFWTASKGAYKMEPVLADGGTVIIYAPHIDEIAYVHGQVLDRIGYHVRDYFLAHMDQVADEPRGVMAHSTLVKGTGTYEHGVEKARTNVVLATRIPQERCERVNLGYMDPSTLHIDEWLGREDEGILVVPRAGEMLYRLRKG